MAGLTAAAGAASVDERVIDTGFTANLTAVTAFDGFFGYE
jgi:hypothetical protein